MTKLPAEHTTSGSWTSHENVVFVSWHHGILVDDLRLFTTQIKTFAQAHPEGYAVMSVSYANSKIPDKAARELLNQSVKNPDPAYRGTVIVLHGSGFGASIVRSITATMAMVKTSGPPDVVVDSLSDGLPHLVGLVHLPLESLKAAALDFFDAVRVRYPDVPATK